jgi:hypothetical protein
MYRTTDISLTIFLQIAETRHKADDREKTTICFQRSSHQQTQFILFFEPDPISYNLLCVVSH